jgi:hypothetical protein
MPPGQGKTLLRCSIATPLHAALQAEARARHVDVGAIVEGRLDASQVSPFLETPMLGPRLEAIMQQLRTLEQQQEAIVSVLEQLVTAITEKSSVEAAHDPNPAPPIASYDQLYAPAHTAAARPLVGRRKGRWSFLPGSHG